MNFILTIHFLEGTERRNKYGVITVQTTGRFVFKPCLFQEGAGEEKEVRLNDDVVGVIYNQSWIVKNKYIERSNRSLYLTDKRTTQ